MSAQHTPGPWKWDGTPWDYDAENEAPWVVTDDVKEVRVLSGSIRCNKENARLIAAAPELLAALQLAVRQNGCDMLMTGEELRQCEVAIAKATGAAA